MTSYSQSIKSTESQSVLPELLALTKPGVTLLLVFTALATYAAASGVWFSFQDAFLLVLTGGLAAGGSAAINHYLERDLDAKMPRTAERPLPSGRLLNPNLALLWGLLLCASGVSIAYALLPLEATFFILLGILIYIPLYTLTLKRTTVWNVVIGGAAGCCPVLTGWAVARADWPAMPIALALLVFFWTPAHFWAYAMRYKDDYKQAGFPMLPNVIGTQRTPPWILAHTFLAVLASVVVLSGPSLIVAALAGMVFLALCVNLWISPTREYAHKVYKASNYYLMLVFLALFLV